MEKRCGLTVKYWDKYAIHLIEPNLRSPFPAPSRIRSKAPTRSLQRASAAMERSGIALRCSALFDIYFFSTRNQFMLSSGKLGSR